MIVVERQVFIESPVESVGTLSTADDKELRKAIILQALETGIRTLCAELTYSSINNLIYGIMSPLPPEIL